VIGKTSNPTLIAAGLRDATPSVLHQRHLRWVLRSSRYDRDEDPHRHAAENLAQADVRMIVHAFADYDRSLDVQEFLDTTIVEILTDRDRDEVMQTIGWTVETLHRILGDKALMPRKVPARALLGGSPYERSKQSPWASRETRPLSWLMRTRTSL
jgi:hypothetical protein